MSTEPIFNVISKEAAAAATAAAQTQTAPGISATAARPFKVLGVQQIAIGGVVHWQRFTTVSSGPPPVNQAKLLQQVMA